MSDPRASITRTVLAPPSETVTSAAVMSSTEDTAVGEVRLIGKRHGRMRCVNLSLTAQAKEVLYAHAQLDGVTLGEALMDLIVRAVVPARPSRPDRSASMRRGCQTVSVFVLLTPDEATQVVSRATASGRSVSDYASNALVSS